MYQQSLIIIYIGMFNSSFNKIFDGFQIRMKLQKILECYWRYQRKIIKFYLEIMEKLWNFLEPLFLVNSHDFFSNSYMTIKWSFSARERKAYVKMKYRPLREKWELCWTWIKAVTWYLVQGDTRCLMDSLRWDPIPVREKNILRSHQRNELLDRMRDEGQWDHRRY